MSELSPYQLTEFFQDFAMMPRFESDMATLAQMAEPEDWNYKNQSTTLSLPILQNYIRYTYRRVAEEKKVAVTSDEKHACWNTGLITSNQEPLFILFEENKLTARRNYWHSWKFARKGQWELNRFNALPDMAHYFENPAQLVYDTRKELRANVEHIIQDNRERFPTALQSMNDYALQNILKGAIDSAKERVRRNYKTAIPQYFGGTIQLLLPLSLTNPAVADLALVVEKFNEFYRASTCLTLDMAYNNARQLARPDRDWLQP